MNLLMNLPEVWNLREVVSRAEDVGRLNEAILQLAVQGKLMAQDPADEPASELLKRIAAEKKRLKIKSEPLPEIGEEERPFPLPNGWEWVRFGDATINRDSARIPLSREQRKTRQGPFDYYGASGVIDKIDDYLFDKPLLLIGEDGANLINRSTPIAFLACGKYWVNNHAHVLDSLNLDVLKYLSVFINAIDLKPFVTGTAQPKMNQSKMNSIVVGLPPLAEQKRIVARVDALLAQTRQLEATMTTAVHTLSSLHTAAIQELLTAVDPDDFAAKWQFIADNFDLLYDETYPETAVANVAALKQAILQLAVQGKLTRQDPADEPAGEMRERIAAEKKRLGIKSGKLAEIGEGERPFALPDGWEWTRLEHIADHRLGKMLDKNKNRGEYYPYLRNLNVQWLRVELGDLKEMRFEESELEEFKLERGDLLICEGGEPGRSAIWEHEISQMMFQKAIHRVRPFGKISTQYLLFHIWADALVGNLEQYFTGATIKHFTGKALANYKLALPPIAEQHRIVARVDALLRLCDDLSAHIRAAQATRIALRDAALAGAR